MPQRWKCQKLNWRNVSYIRVVLNIAVLEQRKKFGLRRAEEYFLKDQNGNAKYSGEVMQIFFV